MHPLGPEPPEPEELAWMRLKVAYLTAENLGLAKGRRGWAVDTGRDAGPFTRRTPERLARDVVRPEDLVFHHNGTKYDEKGLLRALDELERLRHGIAAHKAELDRALGRGRPNERGPDMRRHHRHRAPDAA